MPTTALSSPRSVPETAARAACARVAYAEGDRVVQTLYVPALGTLRVGSSEENDLVLCDDRVGHTHTLLRREGARWWLTLPVGLDGRARLAGHAGTLEQHVAAGRARRRDGAVEIALESEGEGPWASAVIPLRRGRLLVALEDAPAVQVAPLPRVLRRDLRAEVDFRFGGILSAVMIAFFFLGLAAEAADPLAALTPPESVFAFRPLYDTPPEPPAPDMPSETTLTDETSIVADATETVRRDGPRSDRGPSGSTEDGPRLTREEASRQAQLMIGTIGVGSLRDVLAGGAAVADGEDLINSVTDGSVATTTNTGLVARTGRDGTGEELGRIESTTTTVATHEGTPVGERPVRVAVSRPTALPGGDMPMEQVTHAIRSRVAAIRRCYERTLSSNPSARGRLVVGFQVQGSGAFSQVTVQENATGDAELAACVTSLLGRLRVSEGPTGGAASFRYPFVFEPG